MLTIHAFRRRPSIPAVLNAATLAGLCLLTGSRQAHPLHDFPPIPGSGLGGLESPPDVPPGQPMPAGCGAGSMEVPNVYLHSGEMTVSAVDMRIPGRGLDFVWARKYRSRNGPSTAQGNGWDFSYNVRIQAEGTNVRLLDGNTRSDLYELRSNATYTARQFFREGKFEIDGTFTLTFADGGTWSFRALDGSPSEGRLRSSSDRSGNSLLFSYDGAGRLVTITDTLNRAVSVAYDAGGHIQSVTDFTGRSVVYAYYQNGDAGGSAGDLKSARSPIVVGTPNGNDFPAGKTTTYAYSKGFADDRLNHNLLSITDAKGQTWLVNTYASELNPSRIEFDRLVGQLRGGANDRSEFFYASLRLQPIGASSNEVLQVVGNDRVGNVREYFYDRGGRLLRKREFTGRAIPGQTTTQTSNRPTGKLRSGDPDFFETLYEYNEDSLATEVVHAGGDVVQRVFELALDPAAAWRSRGNLREVHRLAGSHVPPGEQAEIVDLYEYETGMGGCCGTNFVTRHIDPRGNVTVHDYDSFGNRIHTQHPIVTAVEDYEYDSFGRMTAHVLAPNGSGGAGTRRRDEMHWYGPADGPQNGYLKETVVDAPNFALTTRCEYDARGNLVRKVDPRGNDALFDVNALNQVVRERSRIGAGGARQEKLTRYDANDNVVRVDVENRNENGVLQANTHFTTTWDYGILDERLRETREIDPSSNAVTEYGYDANRNRTLVRFGEAVNGNQPRNTETTLYDERDLVYRVIRAQGDASVSTTQKDWDGNRNLLALREGLESGENTSVRTYDAYDRLVSLVDPMGNVTERHYDPAGNLTSVIVHGEAVDVPGSAANVRLSEFSYEYDALDRRIVERGQHFDASTQVPIGDGEATSSTAWTADTQISTSTDDHGHVATNSYDTANRLRVATDARGNTSTYDYDANGNVVSRTEVDKSDLGNPDVPRTTNSVYDNLDRRTQQTDNAGETESQGYDSRGNVVLETDPRGNVTRFAYDGLNRLLSTQRTMTDTGDGSGTQVDTITTTQAWDTSSRLFLRTDGKGNPTIYSYDPLDRRIASTFANGTEERVLQMDAHGNELVRRDPDSTIVTSSFDGLGRLTSRVVAPGPGVSSDTTSETYQYDGLSRLVRAQDDDSLVTRVHDSFGNVLREMSQVLPAGPVRMTLTDHDAVGNATRVVYPGGRTILRTFDSLERLLEAREAGTGLLIAQNQYSGPIELAPLPVTSLAEFLARGGGPDGRSAPRPEATGFMERTDFGNGTRLDVQRDAVRRSILTNHFRVAGSVMIDQRTSGWDASGNEKLVFEGFSGINRSYEYDSADRLVRSTSAPPSTVIHYFYDTVGNRTQVNGGTGAGPYSCGPSDCSVNQYTATPFDSRAYDANGNLVQKPSSGAIFTYDYRNRLVHASGGGLPSTTYRYDCLNRRIERTASGVLSRYYYTGAEEIEEQGSSGATVATYVWGTKANLLQMKRGSSTYFYHRDELGSVIAATDSTGTCVERYAYSDFGKTSFYDGFGSPISGTLIGNSFSFKSMRAETMGWYLAGNRFFDPETGRFVQRDPAGIWAESISLGNPFTFEGNNPFHDGVMDTLFPLRAWIATADPRYGPSGFTTFPPYDTWRPSDFRFVPQEQRPDCSGGCTGKGPVHWSGWVNTNSMDFTKRAAQAQACKAAAGDENVAIGDGNDACRKRGGMADCTCRDGKFTDSEVAPQVRARSSRYRGNGMGFSTDFSTTPPTSHYEARYGCQRQYTGTCAVYK